MQSSNSQSRSNQYGLSPNADGRQRNGGRQSGGQHSGGQRSGGQSNQGGANQGRTNEGQQGGGQDLLSQVAQGLKGFVQDCCSGEATRNVGSTERMFSTGIGGMLVASGLLRGRLRGLLLTAIGGALIYRGVTGHCSVYQQLGINTDELEGERAITKGLKFEESITIARSPHELYEVWTQWERLPEILPYVAEVKDLGQGRTRWTARGPLGATLTWEAEVINQETDRLVAWQSLTGGDVDTAGSVHFNPRGDNMTEMTVSMQYEPPGGRMTAMVSEFFGIGADQRVRSALQRFKATMESSGQKSIQGAHASTDSSELSSGGGQKRSGASGNQSHS